MDSSSWIHGNAGDGYTAIQYREQQQHELVVSSEIQGSPARQLHFPEVPPLLAPRGVVLLPYDDQHMANFHGTPATTAPRGMSSTSAFRRYERHLGAHRRLRTPSCGQSMFKMAMSVLANAKMHTAMRYNQQQQQQQAKPSIAERKRQGKFNDSFRALKTVLPPGSKKLGKTSVLITAREYVNCLKSKVCELEEKNEVLQSQLAWQATSKEDDGASEKVDIQMTIAAAGEDHHTGEACTLKIATPAGSNMTDMVLRILQRLKDQMGHDVSLVSMSTGQDGDGPHRASLTLHLKSASGVTWEEEAVRKAVWSDQEVGGINLHQYKNSVVLFEEK